MNQCIKYAKDWFDSRPKAKEWAWFVALWCSGVTTCLVLVYPIKLLIRSLG